MPNAARLAMKVAQLDSFPPHRVISEAEKQAKEIKVLKISCTAQLSSDLPPNDFYLF